MVAIAMDHIQNIEIYFAVKTYQEYCTNLSHENEYPTIPEILEFIQATKKFPLVDPLIILEALWICGEDSNYYHEQLSQAYKKVSNSIVIDFSNKETTSFPASSNLSENAREVEEKSRPQKEPLTKKPCEDISPPITEEQPSLEIHSKSSQTFSLYPPRVFSELKLGMEWKSLAYSHYKKRQGPLSISKIFRLKSITGIWLQTFEQTKHSNVSLLLLRDMNSTMAPYNIMYDEIIETIYNYGFFENIEKCEFSSEEEFSTKEWFEHLDSTPLIGRHLTILLTDGIGQGWMTDQTEEFFKKFSKNSELIWLNPHPEWFLSNTILGFSLGYIEDDDFDDINHYEEGSDKPDRLDNVFVASSDMKGFSQLKQKSQANRCYTKIDEGTKEQIKELWKKSDGDNSNTWAREAIINNSPPTYILACLTVILKVFDPTLLHLLFLFLKEKKVLPDYTQLYHEAQLYYSGLLQEEENGLFSIKKQIASVLRSTTIFATKFPPHFVREIHDYVRTYAKTKKDINSLWNVQWEISNSLAQNKLPSNEVINDFSLQNIEDYLQKESVGMVQVSMEWFPAYIIKFEQQRWLIVVAENVSAKSLGSKFPWDNISITDTVVQGDQWSAFLIISDDHIPVLFPGQPSSSNDLQMYFYQNKNTFQMWKVKKVEENHIRLSKLYKNRLKRRNIDIRGATLVSNNEVIGHVAKSASDDFFAFIPIEAILQKISRIYFSTVSTAEIVSGEKSFEGYINNIEKQCELLIKSAKENNGCEFWNDWRVKNPGIRVQLGGVDLQGINLQHANLQGADLQKANLEEANLQNVNLRIADLRGAKMRKSNLRNANLVKAELYHADLRNASLQYANLQQAYMREVDLQDSDLRDTKLQKASMEGAKLQKTNMRGANLQSTNLKIADLRGANLQKSDLRKANLIKAQLYDADLQDANLEGADIVDADLQSTNLQRVNLQNTTLRGSNLRNANLQDANLQNTDLCAVNLQDANLENIKLQGSYLIQTNLLHAKHITLDKILSCNSIENVIGLPLPLMFEIRKQRPELMNWWMTSDENIELKGFYLQGASLEKADLQGADLRDSNMQYAKLQGSNLEKAQLERAILKEANLEGAILRAANLQKTSLQKANLREAHLQMAYLPEANLEKANLQGAKLEHTYLEKINLREANLREANLLGANLEEANLKDANLQDSNLLGTNLQDANLQNAAVTPLQISLCKKIEGIMFLSKEFLAEVKKENAELMVWWNKEMVKEIKEEWTGRWVESSSIEQYNLLKKSSRENNGCRAWNLWRIENSDTPIKLQHFDFYQCNLQETNLQEANLKKADFREADLRKANFTKANLQNADLKMANLEITNLQDADLRRTHLYQANLQGANLQRAELLGAYLKEADLQDANLENANLERADLLAANLHGANLKETNLQNANLERGNLYKADLQGTCIENTLFIDTKVTPLQISECQQIKDARFLSKEFLYEVKKLNPKAMDWWKGDMIQEIDEDSVFADESGWTGHWLQKDLSKMRWLLIHRYTDDKSNETYLKSLNEKTKIFFIQLMQDDGILNQNSQLTSHGQDLLEKIKDDNKWNQMLESDEWKEKSDVSLVLEKDIRNWFSITWQDPLAVIDKFFDKKSSENSSIKEYKHKKTRMDFVLLPGNSKVKPFLMSKHLVTQEVWGNVMKNNPSHFKQANHPTETVNWYECQRFCSEVKLFLPLTNEWDYACKGGDDQNFYYGNEKKYCWYDENSEQTTRPVGKKAPNPFGIYDILGNVWEWCEDFLIDTENHIKNLEISTWFQNWPVEDKNNLKKDKQQRAYRGSSFKQRKAYFLYPGGGLPKRGYENLGFRVVLGPISHEKYKDLVIKHEKHFNIPNT